MDNKLRCFILCTIVMDILELKVHLNHEKLRIICQNNVCELIPFIMIHRTRSRAAGKWHYSGTPLNRPPLGPVKVSLLEGWPHFRGEFVLKSMLFSKWPEYRGGHISGVLIRGGPD